MHNLVTKRVLRANILFFDSNPIGRIVTRFSKDLSVMDFILPPYFIWISIGVFRAITVTIMVGIVNPYLFIGLAVGIVLMSLVLWWGELPMAEA